ncbi:P-loop containing nucleoside triphosphate hydrolase protein [Podospora didyma]|uniref:P-loop containing nucleoside triphosphate hydrolase protein n=1 Tax=Podospora didyma TaxID=330526 RepID=A0AAE0NI24_9PEZI|nr:P-loop containing nucleoside triphosphate hydrolase protein [Podospora didyma]
MALSTLKAAATGSPDAAYEKFKEHYNQPVEDTDTAISIAVRQQYPSLKVVTCNASRHDIVGYAQAGNGKLTVIDPHSFHAIREFKTGREHSDFVTIEYGRPRVVYQSSSNDDDVADSVSGQGFSFDIKFGRYHYEWEGHEYLVYLVRGVTVNRSNDSFHILCEGSPDDGDPLVCKAIDRLLHATATWATTLGQETLVFNNGRWIKDPEVFRNVQSTSWDDVILEASMKASIVRDVQGFFDARDMYADLGVPWKRGIILHGEPGNGKTLSLSALMKSLSMREPPVPTLYIRSLERANGSQFAIENIFSKARSSAPCLLVLEDLDCLVFDRAKSYFLNEVDGLEANDGILIIATTNNLEKLDPALAHRPSRFDKKYHFPCPKEPERVLYCQTWRRTLLKRNVYTFPESLCEKIAEITEGFSYAYLKELFLSTLLRLAGEDIKGLEGEDIERPETLILWQYLLSEAKGLKDDMATRSNTTDNDSE